MLCEFDVILHLWIVLSFRISMSNRRNKVNNHHYHSMQNTIRHCLFFSASKTVQLHCNCYLSWHQLAVLFSFRHPVHVNCSHDRYIEIWIRIWIWLCNRKISEWEKTDFMHYLHINLPALHLNSAKMFNNRWDFIITRLIISSISCCLYLVWHSFAEIWQWAWNYRPTDWHRLVKHSFFYLFPRSSQHNLFLLLFFGIMMLLRQ